MALGSAARGSMAKAKAAAAKGAAKNTEAGKPKRRLCRRDTEEQIGRLVKQNLGEVSEVQLTQHIVDNQSPLQRLTADKKSARDEGRHLAPSYWKGLKEQYGVETADQQLKVTNDAEVADPALIAALTACRNPNAGARNRLLLLSWLDSVQTVNQRTFCGLAKYVLTLRPGANEAAALQVLAVLKMIHRLDLRKPRAEEQRDGCTETDGIDSI